MSITVDLSKNIITNGDVSLEVRPMHAEIIHVLVQSNGPVTINEIFDKVYGTYADNSVIYFRSRYIHLVRRDLIKHGYGLKYTRRGYELVRAKKYDLLSQKWSETELRRLRECRATRQKPTEYAHLFPNRTYLSVRRKVCQMKQDLI